MKALVLPMFLSLLTSVCAQENAKPKNEGETPPQEIVITRIDRSGKVLSEASIPAADSEKDGCEGQLAINMGTREAPLFWTISYCDLTEKKHVEFGVFDTTRTLTTAFNGSSYTKQVQLYDVHVPWNASGIYRVLSLDGETVNARVQQKGAKDRIHDEGTAWREVLITRMDRDGKVLSESSSPIDEMDNGELRGLLPINMGTRENPELRLIEFHKDVTAKIMRFYVRDSTPKTTPGEEGTANHPRLLLFDVRAPWTGDGEYTIYSLDGETLKATFRKHTGK